MNKITAPLQKHGPNIAFALLVALALFLGACSGTRQKPVRSLYYWSTTFVNDSLKRQFYKAHNVQRLYIRYFDVVKKPNRLRSTRRRGDTHRVHHQRMYAPATPVCRTTVATHSPNERNSRCEERERNTDRLRLEQTNTRSLLSVPSSAAPIASQGRP